MEAKDLRIGNLIYQFDTVENVTVDTFNALDDGFSKDSFEPIPLTEEWLVKFGFECIEKDVPCLRDRTMSRFFLNNFNIEILSDGQIYQKHFESTELINCDYIHQLQNLYFALTGEELTIKK
jgi:hypothetical protein